MKGIDLLQMGFFIILFLLLATAGVFVIIEYLALPRLEMTAKHREAAGAINSTPHSALGEVSELTETRAKFL